MLVLGLGSVFLYDREGLAFCVFSERKLTFTFAICCRPSVCLSSVTLVHPTQAVVIFGNFSTAFDTLVQEIFWRSSQWNLSVVRVKPKRGRKYRDFENVYFTIYVDFGPIEGYISETVQDTRLVSINH